MTHKIDSYVEQQHELYKKLALEIHAKPEVSNYEFFACETLSQQLIAEGFDVTVDVAGHRTGFDARYKSAKPGPVVVFLAEYDALVGIGHACGHNIFGTTSSLAGAALKEVIDEVGGEIRIYGTPGEEGGENGSAKGSFVREGFLDDVDVALCVHPGHLHGLTGTSLANDPVDVEFFGRASHASGAPEYGINALDAVIAVFNNINALREHLTDDVRIHGIITHGGDAPNVVPEYASARFYLRAQARHTLNDVYQKFENIVKAAALATGCTYKFGLFQNSVDNTVVTPLLDAVYERHLNRYGEVVTPRQAGGSGSTDVGNISQVVPTIQPHINISNEPIAGHSIEFREASKSELGLSTIALGAKILAHTALDLILDPQLLEAVKIQHKENTQNQV
ncbi:M20 family metallopeptidase [Erysipelothrix sp. HDW6C]|uniref:M20 family metallopeptidase n=1 Tax=Erysipelothrix sp. HDW6C TaxID=2714930 RepID=UPI00140B3E5B|nr:M20 family metallopeptidase [Erysipelothrix sp. HDW6C]QIK69482.1 M20 family metallopeptidase [Erysipelothrix sp. HDW6C]